MLVTEKATNHENIYEGDGHHHEEMESGPEVDTLEVVLLDAAITKL